MLDNFTRPGSELLAKCARNNARTCFNCLGKKGLKEQIYFLQLGLSYIFVSTVFTLGRLIIILSQTLQGEIWKYLHIVENIFSGHG